ncbi:MAG: MerR family DNA-binding transcriptional regulator [Paracoccaceae bacterium]
MLKIGELSKLAGVSADTLRLYERRGLIKSERLPNGYRVYDPQIEQLVQLIRQGQRLGFTLREMAGIVALLAEGDMSADQTADLMQEKIGEIDAKLAELTDLRKLLTSLRTQSCPLRG